MESLTLAPLATEVALKDRVYEALRRAVLQMDIYAVAAPPRLDERKLADDLGVSRTPIREALLRLEQQGLVQNVPRRGCFIVRKTRSEIVAIIETWAALESMAARLATLNASDGELAIFEAGCNNHLADGPDGAVPIDEYSDNNIRFHQNIIALGGNDFLIKTASRLFDQMHAIRASTIKDPKRKLQSVIDHQRIIGSLVNRQTEEAERQVREHALNLAEHVRCNASYLD